MPDYYAILWRALRKGDFQSVRWRESVFDQMRQMLRDQLRNTRPSMSPTDIRHHTEALESAIDAIRGELAQGAAAAELRRPRPSGERAGDISAIGEARSECRRIAQLPYSHLDRSGRRRRGGCGRRLCLHGFPTRRRTAATAQDPIAKRPITAGECPASACGECAIAGGNECPVTAGDECPTTAE